MKKSEIHFLKAAGTLQISDPTAFLIYDQRLSRLAPAKKIIKKFRYSLGVLAGEELKTLGSLEKALRQMAVKWKESHRQSPIYVLGGGSVGDFGGFVASIYKRGLPLIQIPTTWLAAVDSAHGGKTGLNLAGQKNQIGTFYPAAKIYLIEEIFSEIPAARLKEAMGEVLKIALLDSEKLWRQVAAISSDSSAKLWRLLPQLIEAKWKIVMQDPFEQKNLRHLLNFGHSIGHVVESQLHWPHGECILYGLAFDMIMSLRQGLMLETEFIKIISAPAYKRAFQPERYLQFLSLKKTDLVRGLQADKKRAEHKQIFQTFIARPGHVILKKIPVDLLTEEYSRQQKRAYASK